MEIEEARQLLLSSLYLHCDEMKEAIKTVLVALDKPVLDVIYDEDKKHAHFNGHTYWRDKLGYYRRNANLHTDVYEYFNGKVPEGYEVHHNAQDEDGNFDNSKNNIEHLIMMTKSDHNRLHNSIKVIRQCQKCGKNFEATKRSNAKHCKDCRRLIRNEQGRSYQRDRREHNKKYYDKHRKEILAKKKAQRQNL